MFGGSGSIFPDERARKAREELHEAEAAYAKAEDRLIKARREHEAANRSWRAFYYPSQSDIRTAGAKG